MAASFQFEHRLDFHAERATEILQGVPALPGVFALRGFRATDEPYLTRTADLRRRMVRLLAPPESQSKRLNLRDRVAQIEYCVTGSEFESTLVLYHAATSLFGYEAGRRRLKLHTPFFLRLTTEHAHPRVYTTNRLTAGRAGQTLDGMYGPFPSRVAAERYCDAVLDLFKLRRCYEDLEVHPEHPGCAYGEMKRCMAPCNTNCSAEQYAAEAKAVKSFLDTSGESLLSSIAQQREQASAEMEFEKAAALHVQYTRVKAAAALADDLVRPVSRLQAVVVQAAAVYKANPKGEASNQEDPNQTNDYSSQPDQHSDRTDQHPNQTDQHPDQAAVFLLEGGCLAGPVRLSTLGVRVVKEQTAVGSSLFAQPLMLQAVPLGGPSSAAQETRDSGDSPEARAVRVLETLSAQIDRNPEMALLSDHLSLLRRWYYRPEKQRAGEVFLPNPDGSWPVRRILRGAARMALGEPKLMAETQREAVGPAKLKILHGGREGVERAVPVVARPPRKPRGVAAE